MCTVIEPGYLYWNIQVFPYHYFMCLPFIQTRQFIDAFPIYRFSLYPLRNQGDILHSVKPLLFSVWHPKLTVRLKRPVMAWTFFIRGMGHHHFYPTSNMSGRWLLAMYNIRFPKRTATGNHPWGINQPTVGHISVHGLIGAIVELGSSFSPNLSGLENISLLAMLHGCCPGLLNRKMDESQAFADLGDFLTARFNTTTQACACLGFAVAVHGNTEI